MQVCIRSERGFCGISYTACTDMVRGWFSNEKEFDGMMLRWTTSPRVSLSARLAWRKMDPLWWRWFCSSKRIWKRGSNLGGRRLHDGLGGDPVRDDEHGRQLKAGCRLHSRSCPAPAIKSQPDHKTMTRAGTCVDRLCGEVFCSVTSSAGGNSSSHCPVYSYIRPFTLRCQTALARFWCSFCLVLSCLALEPNPQAPLWQWRGDGRLPGKGVVISNKNTNVFWENLKPKAYWWQTFWFGWYFVVLNFFAGRETGDSAWTTCSSRAPASNVFLMLSSVENMPQQTL